MQIVGCDLHTRYQQVAMLDTETGELFERRLELANGTYAEASDNFHCFASTGSPHPTQVPIPFVFRHRCSLKSVSISGLGRSVHVLRGLAHSSKVMISLCSHSPACDEAVFATQGHACALGFVAACFFGIRHRARAGARKRKRIRFRVLGYSRSTTVPVRR